MALAAGSIAFVGASAQQRQDLDGVSRESFAFVALEDIAPNTTIIFVDGGFSNVAKTFLTGNGSVNWHSNSTVNAGTIIEIRTSTSNVTNAVTTNNGIVSRTNGWNFQTIDAIHAFTGSVTNPTFLAAVVFKESTTQASTLLASALKDGETAVVISNLTNNGSALGSIKKDIATATYVSPSAARTAFNTANNWVTDYATNNGTAPEIPFLTDTESTIYGLTAVALCYLAGTHIHTPSGERRIETLAIGDEITTIDGTQRLRWIGRHSYPRAVAGPWVSPIRISTDAFGQGLPHRDLLVSPWHAILLGDVLVRAADLVNGSTITQIFPGMVAHYLNLEFDAPTVVYAEGVAAETYANHANRHMFENAAEYTALYGDDARVMIDAAGNNLRRFPIVFDGPRFQHALRRANAHRRYA